MYTYTHTTPHCPYYLVQHTYHIRTFTHIQHITTYTYTFTIHINTTTYTHDIISYHIIYRKELSQLQNSLVKRKSQMFESLETIFHIPDVSPGHWYPSPFFPPICLTPPYFFSHFSSTSSTQTLANIFIYEHICMYIYIHCLFTVVPLMG